MQQQQQDRADELHTVFESISDLLYTRGNIGKIREVINRHNATDPPEGPFDINMGHGGLDLATLLQIAASNGEIEYVNWFIENGAKPWRVNDNGETALHTAVAESILPESMAGGIDNTGTLNKAVAVVSILLQHNENRAPSEVHGSTRPVWAKRNTWGRTPFDYAARNGGAEVLKLFISKGAVINGPMFSTQYGEIPDELRGTLTGLSDTIPEGDTMFTRFGTSLLHQAIAHQNDDAFDILMQDGANTSVYDAKGESPLVCAIVNSNWKAVYTLVKSGTVDMLQQHGSVFEYLAPVGSAYQFVRHQAPQYQFDGWTALHLMASCHSDSEEPVVLDILALLVNAGADVRAKTSDGSTAFDMCRNRSFQSSPMALELKRLERVAPWSTAFKKQRKDAVIMSLKHDSIKKSLFRTLPDELMAEFLDDMDNHDVAGTTVGPVI
ncbi:ankyrin repeat-containing domain protein [Baffinella frigidus]|nr:ankyrin repeat-containing domain protein [Cryptophyta sp. CCMP2293]